MSTTSRRTVLAGIAAAVPPVSVAALAGDGSGDSELRRLWAEYLKQADAHAAAWEKYNSVRAVFDAELPSADRISDPLWETINVTDSAMRDTIATILHTEAEGLFGIGVKLGAMPRDRDQQDYEDAVAAVQPDIDRLLGSKFAAITSAAIAPDATVDDNAKVAS